MAKRYSKYIGLIHLLGDGLLINMAFVLAYWLKFDELTSLFAPIYINLFLYFSAAWFLLVLLFKPYKISRITRVAKVIRNGYFLISLHILSVLSFILLTKSYQYSREHLLITYALFGFFLFVWRTSLIYLLRIYRKKGFNSRYVVVIGYGKSGLELRKFFRLHPEYGFHMLGFFDDKHENDLVIGKVSDLKAFVKEHEVHEVYCYLPKLSGNTIKEMIDFGEQHLIKVKLIPNFNAITNMSYELQHYDQIPVLSVTPTPLDEYKNQLVKRTFDVAFSLFVIVFILSWMIPILALLVKVSSPGPVFFKQKRTGKDNLPFWCYKFRSMYVNQDADSRQATKKDCRITPIGAILRKTSLDELPQFFNVLQGDMSVVGPRPHMLKHTEEYAKSIEKFMSRHFVKPGITGLAQAKGYRGETKSMNLMKNRIRLDRFYIRNWSILLDFKIILLTVLALIEGDEKAY